MASQIPDAKIKELKTFVDILKLHPELLHEPRMAFFREYLISLNAELPEKKGDMSDPAGAKDDDPEEVEGTEDLPKEPEPESDPESEVELDMDGVMAPDTDDPQDMGDPSKQELSEEAMDSFNDKRSEALRVFSEGEFEKAIELFTQAIQINANNAVVFAKRGACFLKLKKPNACIRDCTRAIELNPDSAPAYKNRGRAQRLLGNFLDAAKDLRTACKIDFDEQADEWLKEVTPNAKKLEEHQRKLERKRQEKEIKEKTERIKKAREAREKAAKAEAEAHSETGGGFGDAAAGLFSDPELSQAFKDPELAAAFLDISQNPANMMKYQNNPKVMKLAAKLASKAGGGSGNLFNMPGTSFGDVGDGQPFQPQTGDGASNPPKPPPSTDDLD